LTPRHELGPELRQAGSVLPRFGGSKAVPGATSILLMMDISAQLALHSRGRPAQASGNQPDGVSTLHPGKDFLSLIKG